MTLELQSPRRPEWGFQVSQKVWQSRKIWISSFLENISRILVQSDFYFRIQFLRDNINFVNRCPCVALWQNLSLRTSRFLQFELWNSNAHLLMFEFSCISKVSPIFYQGLASYGQCDRFQFSGLAVRPLNLWTFQAIEVDKDWHYTLISDWAFYFLAGLQKLDPACDDDILLKFRKCACGMWPALRPFIDSRNSILLITNNLNKNSGALLDKSSKPSSNQQNKWIRFNGLPALYLFLSIMGVSFAEISPMIVNVYLNFIWCMTDNLLYPINVFWALYTDD
jgi:hypothetical protein